MRPVLIVGLIIAALIAAYFGFRFRASTKGAPAVMAEPARHERVTAPGRQTTPPATVDTRSNDTSADFHTLQTCYFASHELAATRFLSDCREYEGKPEFQSSYAQPSRPPGQGMPMPSSVTSKPTSGPMTGVHCSRLRTWKSTSGSHLHMSMQPCDAAIGALRS